MVLLTTGTIEQNLDVCLEDTGLYFQIKAAPLLHLVLLGPVKGKGWT